MYTYVCIFVYIQRDRNRGRERALMGSGVVLPKQPFKRDLTQSRSGVRLPSEASLPRVSQAFSDPFRVLYVSVGHLMQISPEHGSGHKPYHWPSALHFWSQG